MNHQEKNEMHMLKYKYEFVWENWRLKDEK
jgi:hypothetical protein